MDDKTELPAAAVVAVTAAADIKMTADSLASGAEPKAALAIGVFDRARVNESLTVRRTGADVPPALEVYYERLYSLRDLVLSSWLGSSTLTLPFIEWVWCVEQLIRAFTAVAVVSHSTSTLTEDGSALMKALQDGTNPSLAALTLAIDRAIAVWRVVAAARDDSLRLNRVAAEKATEIGDLELLIYRSFNRLLSSLRLECYTAASDSGDGDADAAAGDLFWYRFFGVRTTAVPLKQFTRAFGLGMEQMFGLRAVDDAVTLELILRTATGLSAAAAVVTTREWGLFLSRFGPLRLTYSKAIACVRVGSAAAAVSPAVAAWFNPTFDRSEAERFLKAGAAVSGGRFVVRFGGGNSAVSKESHAFIVSYYSAPAVSSDGETAPIEIRHTPITHSALSHRYFVAGTEAVSGGYDTIRSLLTDFCADLHLPAASFDVEASEWRAVLAAASRDLDATAALRNPSARFELLRAYFVTHVPGGRTMLSFVPELAPDAADAAADAVSAAALQLLLDPSSDDAAVIKAVSGLVSGADAANSVRSLNAFRAAGATGHTVAHLIVARILRASAVSASASPSAARGAAAVASTPVSVAAAVTPSAWVQFLDALGVAGVAMNLYSTPNTRPAAVTSGASNGSAAVGLFELPVVMAVREAERLAVPEHITASIVHVLLRHRAIAAPNVNRQPLRELWHEIVVHGSVSVAQRLLEDGVFGPSLRSVELAASGDTILHALADTAPDMPKFARLTTLILERLNASDRLQLLESVQTRSGETALQIAARRRRSHVLDCLWKVFHARVSELYERRTGNSVLHQLVKAGFWNSEKLQRLFSRYPGLARSCVNVRNRAGHTPLQVVLTDLFEHQTAAGAGTESHFDAYAFERHTLHSGNNKRAEQEEMVLYLLSQGALLSAGVALSPLCAAGLLSIIHAKMRASSLSRWTILKRACEYNDISLVQLILGPELPTPAAAAAALKSQSFHSPIPVPPPLPLFVNPQLNPLVLSDTGAKPQSDERTAAYVATSRRRIEEHSLSDHTLLHVVASSPHGSTEIARLLLSYRAPYSAIAGGAVESNHWTVSIGVNSPRAALNFQDACGRTPTHYVCGMSGFRPEKLQMLQLFLGTRADVVREDYSGWNSLHFACAAGQAEMVQHLIDAHVPLDRRTLQAPGSTLRDKTALHIAAIHGQWQICEALLRARPTMVDALDAVGLTALTEALRRRKHWQQSIYGRRAGAGAGGASSAVPASDELPCGCRCDAVSCLTMLLCCCAKKKPKTDSSPEVEVVSEAELGIPIDIPAPEPEPARATTAFTRTSDGASAKFNPRVTVATGPSGAFAFGDYKSSPNPRVTVANTPASGSPAFGVTSDPFALDSDSITEWGLSNTRGSMAVNPSTSGAGVGAGSMISPAIVMGRAIQPQSPRSLRKLSLLTGDVPQRAKSSGKLVQMLGGDDVAAMSTVGRTDATLRLDEKDEQVVAAALAAGGGENGLRADQNAKKTAVPAPTVAAVPAATSDKSGSVIDWLSPDHLEEMPADVAADDTSHPIDDRHRMLERYELTVHTLLDGGANVEAATALNSYDLSHVLDAQLEWNHLQHEMVSINRESEDWSYEKKPITATHAVPAAALTAHELTRIKVERNREFFGNKLHQTVIGSVYNSYFRRIQIGQLLRYIAFLVLLTWTGIQQAGRNAASTNGFHRAVINSLVTPPLSHSGASDALLAANGLTPRLAFTDIQSADEFWLWSETAFADTFYSGSTTEFYANGAAVRQPVSGPYILNGQTRVIGVPRFRQLRSELVDCDVPSADRRNYDVCMTAEEEPESTARRSEWGVPGTTFAYETESELNGVGVWGTSGGLWYSGGGYTTTASTSASNTAFPPLGAVNASTTARALLKRLQTMDWIDARTRVVFVEFLLYNANENHYMFGSLMVEFTNTGLVLPSHNFVIQRVKAFQSADDYTLFGCEIAVLVCMGLYLVFQELPQLINLKWSYLSRPYNAIDVVFYTTFGVIVALQAQVYRWGNTVSWTQTQSYPVGINRLAYAMEWHTALVSVWVVAAWIKLFEYFSVFQRLTRLVLVVDILLSHLFELFVLLLSAWTIFGVGEYIAYGYRNADTATFWQSFFFRISDTFTGANFVAAQSADRVLGTAYSIAFDLTVLLILLNLVIGVLATGYRQLIADPNSVFGASYWAELQYQLIMQNERAHSIDSRILRVIDACLLFVIDSIAWIWTEISGHFTTRKSCRPTLASTKFFIAGRLTPVHVHHPTESS